MRTDDDEEPSVKRIERLSEELSFDIGNQESNSRDPCRISLPEEEGSLSFSVTPLWLRSERRRGGESWRRRCLCFDRDDDDEEEGFEIG